MDAWRCPSTVVHPPRVTVPSALPARGSGGVNPPADSGTGKQGRAFMADGRQPRQPLYLEHILRLEQRGVLAARPPRAVLADFPVPHIRLVLVAGQHPRVSVDSTKSSSVLVVPAEEGRLRSVRRVDWEERRPP